MDTTARLLDLAAARQRGAGHRTAMSCSLRRRERIPARPRRSTGAARADHGRGGADGGRGTATAPVALQLVALGRARAGDRSGVDHSTTEHTILDDAAQVAGEALTRGAQTGRSTQVETAAACSTTVRQPLPGTSQRARPR